MPADPPTTLFTRKVSELRLDPISGPPLGPLTIKPPADDASRPLVIGRSTGCDVALADSEGVVSRRHCAVQVLSGAWHVTDLGSRHGTYLNGNRILQDAPNPLTEGDRLRIGSWTFRVNMGESTHTPNVLHTRDDRNSAATLVKRLTPPVNAGETQRRLDLLISLAATLGHAASEEQIGAAALEALAAGSGYPRAAMLRLREGGERVEVLASRAPEQPGGGSALHNANVQFSRSVLAAAAQGETVMLNAGDMPNYGQSIMSLGISSAVCSPIMLNGTADCFLYLDARGRDGRVDLGGVSNETAAFCQAVARLCAMSLSNLQLKRLEEEKGKRERDLAAARKVQQIIMPPAKGRHGAVSYCVHSIPGRFVAGDLFDVIPIDDSRVAVLLGDVVGKGFAAGMVMANVQAHLSRLLKATADVALAVSEVNRLVAEYSRRNSEDDGSLIFLSLWAGVLDSARAELTYVDAGHGHWFFRRPHCAPACVKAVGGMPVGVDGEGEYQAERMALLPGSSLILYSDGVVEQRREGGEQFGIERTLEAVQAVRDPDEEVDAIIAAVREFAGLPLLPGIEPQGFADDVTVASVVVL